MSAQDLSSDGEQSRFRTSIQFAKRWILRDCHLFHPFLRPCVSDYCHKSKHIHFLLPPMHTSSLVVPFIFSLHSPLVTRPTNLLVFIAFVLYYSSIYQSRPFGSLRSLFFYFFYAVSLVPPNQPFSLLVLPAPCSTSQLVIVAANLASSTRN